MTTGAAAGLTWRSSGSELSMFHLATLAAAAAAQQGQAGSSINRLHFWQALPAP
jgi:hypothetical protein